MRWIVARRERARRGTSLALAVLRAKAKRAELIADVHPDAYIAPGVTISVDPRSRNRLEMGPGSSLHEGVLLLLRGGTVRLGERSSIRRGSVLNVSGELHLERDNILSYYNVVHCAERVHLGPWTSASEFCTFADSRHFHTDDGRFFMENVETAPIEIGANVWLSTGSTVLMGVTIGDEAVVAAGAVVHRDVPARALVGGVPARLIQQK